MTVSPRTPGVVVGGRYRLEERIGVGALAEVWRATDEVLARPVAVKILHPHLAADAEARRVMQTEAVAGARLHHPHIVSLYDSVLDEEPPALVFELVAGHDLRRRLEGGPLEPTEVIRVGRAVADALAHVHDRGLVHGDVKPANILLAADGRVLLADVGLAAAAQTVDATRPDADPAGTARYLAPEVLEGNPATARSDLYSLATVLYEAVTGRRTFEAPTEAVAAVARLQREPARARHVRPDVPRHLDELLHRMLRRDPQQRPATAAEVRAALDLHYVPEAPAPPPPPPASGERTPPAGTAPSFRQAERSWLVPTAVMVLVAAGLGVAAVTLGATGAGRQLLRGARDAVGGDSATTVTFAAASAFDPDGDGHEHDERAAAAIDGDPATTWTTETYRQRDLGPKQGVGIVVALAQPSEVREVTVRTPTPGWSGEVRLGDGRSATLDGWRPVAAIEATGETATVAVDPAEAGAVLVWITDVGPGHQVEIAEVEVRG